ncbi:MAG: hypothetical protein JWR72_1353 [Flavisolibacter sp.]|jgi:hypothetical protein|nr:hypothetical protein [Flavisolibacter sp.]
MKRLYTITQGRFPSSASQQVPGFLSLYPINTATGTAQRANASFAPHSLLVFRNGNPTSFVMQ